MQLQNFCSRLSGLKGSGEQYTARCPAHADKHNSLSVGVGEDERILLHCHAGCSTADILAALDLQLRDLFPEPAQVSDTSLNSKPLAKRARGEVQNANAKKDAAKPASMADLQEMPAQAAQKGSKARTGTAARARGETNVQICKLGEVVYPYTDPTGHLIFETVRIQYSDGSKTFRQRRAGEDGKPVYNLRGVEPVLYRLPAVRAEITGGTGTVYLCEGEKDADALAALGFCATTAPMGAGKWRDSYTEALRGAQMVYILPDHDKPGRAHACIVAKALQSVLIPVNIIDLRAQWPALPRKGDVSDVLAALGDRAAKELPNFALLPEAFASLAATRDLVEDAPPYRFPSAADYLADDFWKDVARNARQIPVNTGFTQLDKQLDGRLYAGLYVVGSVSSLGKTAFCLQMADHIAAQGQDVLFFTLEMSRMEMVARSLTRVLFTSGGGASQYNIGHVLYDKVDKDALAEAVRAYHAGMAGHIAFIEGGFGIGVEEVAEQAMLHYAATGRAPVLFVDYLQILRAPDPRMSDKQVMDHCVVRLKRLSRELDTPVIAVSSFNRQNYSEEVNMAAFKESGAIEYSADFVLGLQARGISARSAAPLDEKKLARMVAGQTKDAKQQDPRPIEAVTLKNRRGPAWACFELDFYPRQNYFAETGR